MSFAYMYICTCVSVTHGDQKRRLDSLELELDSYESRVGAEN